MKVLIKLWMACLILLIGTACQEKKTDKEWYLFSSFHEPADGGLRFLYSEDGVHWDSIAGTWLKPELGQKILRDPSILRDKEGTFHLVWTIAWRGDTGFGYASSKDLIHWSNQQRIPAMDSIASTVNVWAPELFYDDENDQYLIIYASCVVDAHFELGVEDELNNHRLYCVKTKDFQTFSKPELFYDPGFSVIDAILIKRAPGDYVMVLKDNTRPNRNLKVAFASSAEGPYSPASEAFTENFVEGPTATKVGDDYYIYFDVYEKKIFGAMKTQDFVHFTDMTDSIRVPEGHKHGTICRAPESIIKALIEKANENK
jgi:hypothetical protein